MKLTSAQVKRTVSQFEVRAIPDSDPVVLQLTELFGDHTFFLDNNGLNIVEPTAQAPRMGTQAARVVNLANWSDANLTSLAPHEPEPTDAVVDLGSELAAPQPLIGTDGAAARLREDIDRGRTGDKVDWPDPSAAPLGTDEEAAGTPLRSDTVEWARQAENARLAVGPQRGRGLGAAWILIVVIVLAAAGLLVWAVMST